MDPTQKFLARQMSEQAGAMADSAANAEKAKKRLLAQQKRQEALRIKRREYAKDKLKIPGVLRTAPEGEWQLHQWAAGLGGAPTKPPTDWDRANFNQRQGYQNHWRDYPPNYGF